ncbi:hypothetical protein ACHWQZ_G006457 [Mnemiopsis leidyi]
MAAEVLKKKIQELMKERDDALEKGDELERELNAMKEELLKAEFEKKELERRFRLTEDELDNQSTVRNDLKKKSINLTVEDERIKDDMKSQVQSINEMEELIQLIDKRYEELELDYNETMEDLNAL